MLNNIGSIINTQKMGAGWQPKESRIRVGRDVGLIMSATGPCGTASRTMLLGQGDDVTLKSRDIFFLAKYATQSGGRAYNFRHMSTLMDEKGDSFGSWNSLPGVGGAVIQQKGDYVISYSDGTRGSEKGLFIYKKDGETGAYAQVDAMSGNLDARITWDAAGAPTILKGQAALTDGVLKAQGENELLFRASKVDVAAGGSTTVFNVSSHAGIYSGGDNVTYLGSYEGGTFTDTEGKVNFAGYFSGASFSGLDGKSVFSGVFEGASIALQKGKAAFSGYFSGSEIQAGNNGSTASGLFIDGSVVKGGDGDDLFSGRFIESDVDGGKGDDTFGSTQSMSKKEILYYNQGIEYSGLAADFVNSTINAGEGDDTFKGVMWGGTLDLDEGENQVLGMFAEATVNGGKGNDSISAIYSHVSFFDTGLGNDTITLTTADRNTVTADEGENLITLGRNDITPYDKTWQTASEYFSMSRPLETGELQNNAVNTEKGDNMVAINHGQSTVVVLNGNEYEKKSVDGRNDLKADAGRKQPAEETFAPSAAASSVAEGTFLAEAKGSLLPEAAPLPSPEDKKEDAVKSARGEPFIREAVGRSMNVYGFEPLTGETPAVTVQSGPGESRTFNGVERHNVFEKIETPVMMRVVRRYNGFSSASWQRWERLKV